MKLVLTIFLTEGFICSLFDLGNASKDTCEMVSLILLYINTLVLAYHVQSVYGKYRRGVVLAMVASVFLKGFLILWDYYGTSIFVLPNSHIDSEQFHNEAVYFMYYAAQNKIQGYSYIVGWIYRFFGMQRMTAQYFNVLLSFIGVGLLDSMMDMLKIDKSVREKTLVLAALLPNYLIMSSILLRECIISVILCLSLYLYMIWWKGGHMSYMIGAVVCSMAACYFHSGSIAVMIGMAVSLVVTRKFSDGSRKVNVDLRSIVLSVVFFFGFMFLFDVLSDSILGRFHGLSLDVINNFINEHNIYASNDNGNSTYTAGFSQIRGLPGLIINSPIRMVYFLWVPMPWAIRGMGDMLAFFGNSLFYGGTAFYAIYYLWKKRIVDNNKAIVVSVLIIALAGALVFAWGVDSAGSALRHREKFYFIYLLLFALTENGKTVDMVLSER